jgi:hypothetical protein
MQGNPTLVEVMSYLPVANGVDKLVLNSQSTADLEKAIAKSHQENLKYAKKIAFLFRGNNDYDTCKNIWNFIKKYIPYSIEPVTNQNTKSLPRMLDDARKGIGSDCKMYSVLSGVLLNTLGIKFKYKLTGYSVNHPQHIYCVTDKYIIDGVLPYFNYEKKPIKYQKHMALYNLSGIDDDMEDIGKIKLPKFPKRSEIKDKLKNLAQGYVRAAKVVGAAVPRNAFLLIVSVNARGLATKLDKLRSKDAEKLKKTWVNLFGGDIDNLNAAINKGITKKPLFGQKKMSGVDGIGAVDILAALATAAPIILKMMELFKQSGINVEDVPVEEIPPPPPGTGYDKSPEGENVPERPYTASEQEKVANAMVNKATGESDAQAPESGTPPPADKPEADKKKMNTMLLVGAGAVALYLFTRKKGK